MNILSPPRRRYTHAPRHVDRFHHGKQAVMTRQMNADSGTINAYGHAVDTVAG